jgi:nucleoside-diphosphate-sugar epimerase
MANSSLTVAVTGPTGEIGKPFVAALERTPEVGRVLAMARRPFDPRELGWEKTEYRRGDILDRSAIDELVAGADVVVHLAFIVVDASADSYEINIEGSRNVFAATAAAGIPRLVYTSSVAAYGYHDEAPALLTEDVPTQGTERHAYSHQKAAVERVLAEALAGSATVAYVFRPCVVAGPLAPALIDQLPYVRYGDRVPLVLRRIAGSVPGAKPVLPDHGVPFQLVHHDDVASALKAAVLGKGEPGTYNLAASGEITMSDLADALHWYSVPVPDLAVDATAEIVSRLPFMPAEASWVNAARVPVLMSTEKARKTLRWKPKHDTSSTLKQTVAAARPDLEAGQDSSD